MPLWTNEANLVLALRLYSKTLYGMASLFPSNLLRFLTISIPFVPRSVVLQEREANALMPHKVVTLDREMQWACWPGRGAG